MNSSAQPPQWRRRAGRARLDSEAPAQQSGARTSPAGKAAARNLPWLLLALSVSLNFLLLASRTEGHAPVAAATASAAIAAPTAPARALGSAASASSGSSSAPGGHKGPHQHDSLLFLFNALVLGALVMHLSTYIRGLQQTTVLFVLGMAFALILELAGLRSKIGVLGDSYGMWMVIDPHLLLFALLPALLAGDAMTIDTDVAKRVAWQCLYLAGPGVLLSAFAVAGFLKLYFGWSFLVCLMTGAILCATDPVAVVALLKELGASPVLTVQIQGESLLNDGTAIVLYLISYNMIAGESYDILGVVTFLVKTVMMAWALGMFIGYFFLAWIRLAGNKLEHNSSMIQISLTICCAYWSFIIAEGVLHISGVLATVAASLVLAHHMWPHICHADSMLHVWHAIEHLGNSLIFFLGGCLVGKAMVDMDLLDFLHLFVLYIVLLIVRGGLIFASRPLLRLLSKDRTPVTMAEAVVMTWGGLRGAVGLALAIQVYKDGASNEETGVAQIDPATGQRILFFVSGIALLTTTINAPSCPALVQRLGIITSPDARKKLLLMMKKQLLTWSEAEDHPEDVTKYLRETVDDITAVVSKSRTQTDLEGTKLYSTRIQRSGDITTNVSHGQLSKGTAKVFDEEFGQPNCDLIETFENAKKTFEGLSEDTLALIGELPKPNLLGQVDNVPSILWDTGVDVGMARVISKAFMSFVRADYWRQMDSGNLRPGSQEATLLLTSVLVATSKMHADLTDFNIIMNDMEEVVADVRTRATLWRQFGEMSAASHSNLEARRREELAASFFGRGSHLDHFVSSAAFNMGIAAVILLNTLFIGLEDLVRGQSIEGSTAWLCLNAAFVAIFLVESLLKQAAWGLGYFHSATNIFDFMLVVIGIAGVIFESVAQGSSSVSSEARVMRLARILRVLRFLRVFRLFYASLHGDKTVNLELGVIIKHISALKSFIGAHLRSQVLLLKYFAGNGQIDGPEKAELGRCLLQSQIQVYSACELLVAKKRGLQQGCLRELESVFWRKEILSGFEDWISAALRDGALETREADAILHPLHHCIAECMKEIDDMDEGVYQKTDLEMENEYPRLSSGSGSAERRSGGNSEGGAAVAAARDEDALDGVLPGSLRASSNAAP